MRLFKQKNSFLSFQNYSNIHAVGSIKIAIQISIGISIEYDGTVRLVAFLARGDCELQSDIFAETFYLIIIHFAL